MLAPHHQNYHKQYPIYQNKLITIISPYSGEQFKIELSGEEGEFRELLATLLNIDPSYIKGLKDSFGNYYTLSCALKDPFISANGNNLFSLVLNISHNNYNKYKQYSNSYNKNLLYNINNNYHNRTEYNEIYIGNKENRYMGNNYDYKNKNKIRKYSTLIKKLIPAINRNFKEQDDYEYNPDSSYFDEFSTGILIKYQKILDKIKKKFDKEQMNILKELLKMENITIINYFKIYEKTNNKKELLNNLKSLSKKYQKKKKKKKISESENESESESEKENNKKEKKSKKIKKHHNKKSSSESEESSSHSKKHKKNQHKKQSSSSSSEDKSDNENNSNSNSNEGSDNIEENESEEDEEESEESKHNFPIECSSLKELINAIKEQLENKIDLSCLFSNDIDFNKKTETQKMQLIKDEFGIKDFVLTENSFELIKKYYENILKKVIMKDLSKEEKELLLKLIKKKNKSIKLRFKALLRHNNYDYLITDIKECLNDKLKRKKNKNKNQSDEDEQQINLDERESMSINSNSNNDNEGEEYLMDESTKSIRKNERMAKNNKKNKNEQQSPKSKSKDEDSSGQIKLFQMEDNSQEDSESNKKESKKESKKENKKENSPKNGDDLNKDDAFLNLINKLKDEGKLDITEKEVNILSNEFKKENEKLRSVWEIYQIELEEEDFIDSIKVILKILNKNNNYDLNDNNENNDANVNNKENKDNKDNNNSANNINENNKDEDKPYVKEVIAGLKGVKYGKKGNKKIINILLKNKIFTKEEMRNIEEDLDQNNQFVSGAFELLFVTMNVEDFVENLNIRLHHTEGENGQNQNSALPIDDEKYNQIRNNLENIVKSLSEEDQNKIRELFEKKDINLLNILESEVDDIEKAKTSILNFLGKN